MLNTFSSLTFFQEHIWLSAIALIWVVIWKGIALWKSARKGQSYWFVALLIINTLGLLEILYIFVFSRLGKKRESPTL